MASFFGLRYGASEPPPTPPTSTKVFHLFDELPEDLYPMILGFVASAPFMTYTGFIAGRNHGVPVKRNTMCSILSLVNWRFYNICTDTPRNNPNYPKTSSPPLSNVLWSDILSQKLSAVPKDEYFLAAYKAVSLAASSLRPAPSIFSQYQAAVLNSRKSLLCFYMSDDSLRIGEPFGRHFFEPRYRLLARLNTDRYSAAVSAWREGTEEERKTIPRPEAPTFAYVPVNRPGPGVEGWLVAITQIQFYHDGRCDVHMLPVGKIVVEEIRVYSGEGDPRGEKSLIVCNARVRNVIETPRPLVGDDEEEEDGEEEEEGGEGEEDEDEEEEEEEDEGEEEEEYDEDEYYDGSASDDMSVSQGEEVGASPQTVGDLLTGSSASREADRSEAAAIVERAVRDREERNRDKERVQSGTVTKEEMQALINAKMRR